jgi:hypothetical protein
MIPPVSPAIVPPIMDAPIEYAIPDFTIFFTNELSWPLSLAFTVGVGVLFVVISVILKFVSRIHTNQNAHIDRASSSGPDSNEL